MAHKTMVGGTAYNITGGKSMVSGTAYNITSGKTLVGGTGYNIGFGSGEPTAMLYSDGNMVFQLGGDVESGKTLTASYTGFEDATYSNYKTVPWNAHRANIKNIYCNDEITPMSMAHWFYTCRNLVNFNYINFNINAVTNMAYTYNGCSNLTGSPVCGDKVTNMNGAYHGCYNLTGSPVCGNNVTVMDNAYHECINLTGSPVCGDKVTRMYSTYRACYNLTGHPVCGNNVTEMHGAYDFCYNLTGSPVCGDKVIDMAYAYRMCNFITGHPVCGNNVTNMQGTYYLCKNLTGSPVCGDKVTDIGYTYNGCSNLTGSPVCGNNVKHMDGAYRNCWRLSGHAICGINVINMAFTYYNCRNIGANAYFYSSSVSNVTNCFYAKSNSRRLNIYVVDASLTKTTVLRTNTYSLVGANITWTNAGTYQYNTTYNIYIYPVANVAAAAIANGDEEANANAGIIIDDSEGGSGGSSGGSNSGSTNYTVESVSGASYGFALNSNGYYESGNKGQSSSAALCKVTFVADGVSNVYFDCINFAESNYDYGLLSVVDQTLTTNNIADTSNVFKNFKGSQSASIQTVNYGVLPAGEHFVYVKYIKDVSVNSNNDSLQFKIRIE